MPAARPAPPASTPTALPWWLAPAIFGAVLAVYFPVLGHGFVWDDDAHVTVPALRSLHGLWRIWFEVGATQQYYPLLHSVFWLEQHAWGDAAFGYHLANLTLHAGAALLFARVLHRLAVRHAWLAALVFAVHPVQVESVAWISEQKNTLSTIFYLGAALAYLRFDETRHRASYGFALGLFLCALLTKTVTATLPAALLVVFWWRHGRIEWRREGAPLLPFFVAGALAGLHTAWLERTLIGAEGAAYDLGFLQRLLLAGRVIPFYLGKLIWPAGLTFIYPRWTIDPATVSTWLPLAGVIALTAGLWLIRRRTRAPLAAWLFFVGSLFPVLGFFNVFPFQYSFVADHFQYLASLGLIALAAGALPLRTAHMRRAGVALGTVVIATLGFLTWRQAPMYRDSTTLFRTTIDRNPACWMAYNNLGRQFVGDPARLPEAIALFEKSLALHPGNADALSNLGLALSQTGRAGEAIAPLELALRLKPKLYQAHNNYGIALAGAGRLEEAAVAFSHAAQVNPHLPQIHDNWAKVCRALGQTAEADAHFAEAARLRARPPGSP